MAHRPAARCSTFLNVLNQKFNPSGNVYFVSPDYRLAGQVAYQDLSIRAMTVFPRIGSM